MVTLFRVMFAVALWVNATQLFSWNALGHRLVAQIAYDALNKSDRRRVGHQNQLLNLQGHRLSFVNAAPWLDYIHQRQIWGVRVAPLHYIDIPFSVDGTPLKPPRTPNALTGLDLAANRLSDSNSSDFDKGLSVRILTHVVADLHQPLHAADQYSHQYPDGDRGGNLFRLAPNSIARNLHAYWDRGGGWLLIKGRVSNRTLRLMARNLEKKWPCHLELIKQNPNAWSQESFRIAVEKAYSTKRFSVPSTSYRSMVQAVSQERVALAGCRLASYFSLKPKSTNE